MNTENEKKVVVESLEDAAMCVLNEGGVGKHFGRNSDTYIPYDDYKTRAEVDNFINGRKLAKDIAKGDFRPLPIWKIINLLEKEYSDVIEYINKAPLYPSEPKYATDIQIKKDLREQLDKDYSAAREALLNFAKCEESIEQVINYEPVY